MGNAMEQPGSVKIAVIGLGRMGKRHVNTLLYRVPDAQVVAICTTEPHEIAWAEGNDEYQRFGITAYDSYDKTLAHPGLQAVWISTSTDVHASQTLAAIEKNLHVLCEKPISTDLDEVRTVIAAAQCHLSLKIMTGFSRRFDASYRTAHHKIHHLNSIGTPFLVRSQTCDLLDTSGFFVRYAARNGGIFVDCAIHDIDLTLWYLSDPVPKACWAVGALKHHPELAAAGDVDNAVGVVEFWEGKMAYFHCSRTQAHGHDVCTEITGQKGKVMVNVIPRRDEVVVADRGGMRHEVQPEYWERFEEAFATEAREFVQCVREDGEVPLKLEVGLKAMVIGTAFQDALRSGEVIRFDQKGERV